ncbi:PREDICTED: thrombospondin type-1 domain-containing protein 7B isoform X1 [Calidris pugnax]|uniref:thrombospondin type-1 domain-containing protein 7B isoform X1 n=1 Tax=Calidris pugnax TaxID=198806 RepID=UPI00071DC173|nr:PREDICTED: thrombospondin type-1 domain-containing protein 7B isoform X1 [Calidris pugnax]
MLLQQDWVSPHWAWKSLGKSFLLFVFLMLQTADLEARRGHQFVWKTGHWGRCVGDCGSGGVRSRAVWCTHLEGWTTYHANCHQKDKPESQRRCFRVCDWHLELFEWEVSGWERCGLVPAAGGEVGPGACVTAQHGLQRRSVRCLQKLNRTVVADEICEYFTPQPPAEQACLVPCPRDCVVAQFSGWSQCGVGCAKSLQHRTRAVIAPPLYGGAPCPNLTESRACGVPACPLGEEEHTYSLRVGPWGQCRLPQPKDVELAGRTMLDLGWDSGEQSTSGFQGSKPHHRAGVVEIGYQTRQLRCVRSDGKNAALSHCVQDPVPLTFKSCVIARDCETSEWSSWSACSRTCGWGHLTPGFRSRRRGVRSVAVGAGRPCPELEEREACGTGGKELLQPCPRFAWRTSEWKACQVSLLLDQQDPHHHKHIGLCGGGIQTREVYCVQISVEIGRHRLKEVTRPVDGKLCLGPAPSSSQLCNLPCPSECVVSAWSLWGPCLHENCQDHHGRRGFRMRHRQVIVDPVGTLTGCPHLIESIPCEDPVCYEWIVSEGICVTEHGRCGPGNRMLKAVCKNKKGEEVPHHLCSDLPRPEVVACEIPCATDCVISEWSPWSPCSHSCSSKNAEGSQSRSRSILALPAEGGKACPPDRALQEHRACNDHPCVHFFWETSPWSSCSEDVLVTALNATINWSGEATCGVGIQTRKVFCMKSSSGQVTPKRCPESIRPETVRPCLLLCKKDCLVTPFSEWTRCPTACQPGNTTAVKQSRYRIIIQEAVNGGQACPDTLYEERECEDIPVCPVYRWKTHRWSHCVLVPDSVRQAVPGHSEACGDGLQSRAVTCLSEYDDPADVSDCLRWAGAMPSLVQECHVPCKDDCTFTPWSKFTSCSFDCESTRSRRRSLTGRSRKRDKCQNTEVYPQVETEPCPCELFTSQPHGNWSDCIIGGGASEPQPGARPHGDTKECGEGVRLRAVACYDKTGRLVEPSRCSSSGYIEESCTVPCPFDCKLSDWSSWSPCSSSCGPGVKVRSKWLKEKPYNGGRPCPKLDLKNQAQVHEAVPCYTECNQYSWVVEPWSPCKINSEQNSLHCGEGIQTRKVRCVSAAEDHGGETVPNALCNQAEIPDITQKCSLYCPSECAVSDWGQWSTCPQVCDPNVMQTRTRQVLRSSASTKPCPEVSQVKPCILNQNCFQYQYNLTGWSGCQLGANATCGHGERRRLLSCQRSDGAIVSTKLCQRLGLEKPVQTSSRCVVGCAVDCRLSAWSAWSQCSHTCGAGGQMVRGRSVVLRAAGEGRPCPEQLTQHRSCPVKPCYSWLLGPWSPCRVQGGQCGDGLQVRNLTCVVHDASASATSKPVENTLCGELPSKESVLQLPCSVPCPGDCHLTEWSEWSSCELTCINGRSFETTGRQSRSRAFIVQSPENQESCSGQEMETRPCSGGKCYDYVWKTSLWRDNERTVWCQRSDGINVTGGCALRTKPAEVRHCSPACRKPFSYCTQRGVCGCERGYTEIMRSNGFLDYCMKVPGLEDKKADVKTIAGKNKPVNSKMHDIFKGWSIQPFNPDGKLKMWVYGVSAGGFLIIVFLIFTSYLMCKKTKQHQSTPPQQKPLTLAYDGDIDM